MLVLFKQIGIMYENISEDGIVMPDHLYINYFYYIVLKLVVYISR